MQWLTLTKQADDEPSIHVPVTPGWTLAPGHAADQPTVRGLLGDDDARENGHSPLIQITLNQFPKSDDTPEKIALNLMNAMGSSPTIGQRSRDDVCGALVYRTDFTASDSGTPMSGTQLVAFINVNDETRWAAMAILLTANPDNPVYVAQRDAMLKGFHLNNP